MASADGLLAYHLHQEAAGATKANALGFTPLDLLDTAAEDVQQVAWSPFGRSFSSRFNKGNNSALYIPQAQLPFTWPCSGEGVAFTFGGVVRFTTLTAFDAFLGMFGDCHLWIVAGPKIQFHLKDGATANHTIDTDDNVVTGTAYHFACRWNGDTDGEVAFFLQGVKQETTHTIASVINSSNTWNVGALGATGTFEFDGDIGEDWAFDRRLSDAEIVTIRDYGIESFANETTPGDLAQQMSNTLGGLAGIGETINAEFGL